MSAHHLILSNPFNDSSSSEDDPTTITASAPTNGLRAQLNHLIPRHTFFRARIHIHQIANIPLVSGEFGVKWKFKNVHTPSGNKQGGILGIVKSKSTKGKGKEENEDDDDGDTNSQGSGEQPSQLLSADWKPPSTPSSTAFSASSTSSRTAVSSAASTFTASSRSSSSSAPFSQASSTAFSASTASSGPSSTGTTTPSNSPPGSNTAARGQTAFLPLKDHGVTWDHTLDLLLRMDVERDTLDLLSSPLTLTVLQADAEQGHSKSKGASNGHTSGTSRFGVVYLDLAQYAGKGEVGRRYLLRNSKTNATLKLTISVTHASGPSEFHAPPLPKGEISNGISGILEENEVYRTRPRGLNLYGPYEDQEELEIDLLGAKAKAKAKEGDNPETKHKHSRTISAPPTPVFDPERLPHAYGPKTTETLIEALFNPVAVGERRRESPFTVYVDPGVPASPLPRPLISGLGSPTASGMAGMTLRSPGTPPGAGTGAGRGTRPMPTRSGSGIGAGLGIMGLGMGMGIGMGVGVGVTGGRGSMDSRRPSQDGAGRAGHDRRRSLDRRAPSNDTKMPVVDPADRRQASQGAASVWSASTDLSGVSADVSACASTETGTSAWSSSGSSHGKSTVGHERGVSFENESESVGASARKGGMKGWFKKKMGSRPGTPTAGLAY